MNRWITAGLLEAQKNLRRVPGNGQINKLKQALTKQKGAKKWKKPLKNHARADLQKLPPGDSARPVCKSALTM